MGDDVGSVVSVVGVDVVGSVVGTIPAICDSYD